MVLHVWSIWERVKKLLLAIAFLVSQTLWHGQPYPKESEMMINSQRTWTSLWRSRVTVSTKNLSSTSWWFQPIWKILVKLDHFPSKGKIKKCLKPPPSLFWPSGSVEFAYYEISPIFRGRFGKKTLKHRTMSNLSSQIWIFNFRGPFLNIYITQKFSPKNEPRLRLRCLINFGARF